MKVYVFQAALLCEGCGEKTRERIRESRAPHVGGTSYDTGDSDDCPQGPYPDGGGEADSPQHCDQCQVFLENPLTDDGREYVQDVLNLAIRNGGTLNQTQELWAARYRIRPRKLVTISIVLEVEEENDGDAMSFIDDMLDNGTPQETINDDGDGLYVVSAVATYGAPPEPTP